MAGVGGGRIDLAAALVVVALWSATAAAMQLLGALNVAYGEREVRGFLRLVGTALLFALGTVVFAVLALGGVLGVPLALAAEAEAGGHGPCRACRCWHWASWGGAVGAFAWLLGSASVSWYMQRVGRYDWLYGSVGAVLGFMLWSWISTAAVLAGAVLNAELERQALPSTDPAPPFP
jgi:membrane protein